ncbi:pathogenicity island protein, partial [Staphylococcus aureus]|nr:pathogenicity island protein [Staphylococcus aureus]
MQAVKEHYNLDEQAQSIGLITGISNEIYYCSISYLSTVYLEYIDNTWTA